ncbi:MAG: GNAT family N-acetyltransferase [Candidatus Aminicenantes bacterium]|nr:GNAT family N-acetyltransferase [Candidatus Aminicenantes bacterium]
MSSDSYKIISLTQDNIDHEHICCGFSDQKHVAGTQLKKELIKRRLSDGFKFKKIDVRGKVLIEYVPAEFAWSPIEAPGYTFIHCFWVSGRFKRQGLGTKLLDECIKDSREKNGIVCVTSKKVMPFLTDKGFFQKKGFKVCDTAPPYFELMVKQFQDAPLPKFRDSAKMGTVPNKKGLTFIYSNLCPFTDHWVDKLIDYAQDLNIPSQKSKITTLKQAQNAPSAFSTFSIFYNGKFLTHKIPTQKEFIKIVTEKQG